MEETPPLPPPDPIPPATPPPSGAASGFPPVPPGEAGPPPGPPGGGGPGGAGPGYGGPSDSGPPPRGSEFPWERPGLDFFSALFETVRLLATHPRRAFEALSPAGSLMRPLVFAVLTSWPGLMAGTLWDIALSESIGSFAPWGADERVSSGAQIVFAALAPVWLPLVILVGSAIQHLFLMLVGAGGSGWVATFRVACYAQAATLLGVLPLCGNLLGVIGHLVLAVIGYSAVHRVSAGRAALGVFIPALLCCGCLALLLMMGAAAWFGSRGGAP